MHGFNLIKDVLQLFINNALQPKVVVEEAIRSVELAVGLYVRLKILAACSKEIMKRITITRNVV